MSSTNVTREFQEGPARSRLQERLDKWARWMPLVIFAVAFLLRAALLAQLPHERVLFGSWQNGRLTSNDEGIQVAVSLLQTGRFADPFCLPTGPTAHVPPSYPVVTALVFRIFGMGLAGAVVRNLINIAGYALMFALLPAAAVALGMRRWIGALGGLIATPYPMLRATEVYLGRDEWLDALLLLGLTIGVLRLIEKPSLHLAAAYGAGWGALMYVEPSAVIVLPVHMIIFVWCARRAPLIQRMKCCILGAVVMIVLVLPWMIRDRVAVGGWVPMRDDFGIELRVSNDARASGSLPKNLASEWFCSIHPSCSPATALKVRELGELRFNHEDLREALSWISNNKRAFCRLTAQRMLFFWADLPSNRLTFLIRASVSLAAFLGLWLMWREGLRVQAALFGGTLLAYPLVYYLVEYSSRYVATILPALLIPAGFTWSVLGARLWRRMLPATPR